MRTELTILAKRLGALALPFVVFAAGIAAIDPYNFVPGPSIADDEIKQDISFRRNYAMWKMLDFSHDPAGNILLGDSRMMELDTGFIDEVTGRRFYNFGYGGGSLREAIDTFWFASSTTTLESVCLGVNLTTFNAADTKDRVSEVRALLRNPALYVVNRNVIAASFDIARAVAGLKRVALGKPTGSKDEFWKHQIDVTTRGYYANYRYPDAYLAELRDVATYCREHGIELSFLIFPSHVDLQRQVTVYGLDGYQDRMKSDLHALGEVYDFEFDSELTRDRDNYRDPYHFNDDVMRRIVEDVWGGSHAKASATPTAGIDG